MSLKLNIGLCKKVGEPNYSSRGANVNIEVELASSLVREPQKLQDRIKQLFGLVRTSLDAELNGNHSEGPTEQSRPQRRNGNSRATQGRQAQSNNGGATRAAGQRAGNPAPATASQIKAIFAIAGRQQIDVTSFLKERFGVRRPDDLGMKEASRAIEELKADEANGQEG